MGYSDAEVLWMQQEQSRLECKSESILQKTFKKYPLDSNPRELLIATGSKPVAERHLKEFYREMILNNFYVMCMTWFNNISNYIFLHKMLRARKCDWECHRQQVDIRRISLQTQVVRHAMPEIYDDTWPSIYRVVFLTVPP